MEKSFQEKKRSKRKFKIYVSNPKKENGEISYEKEETLEIVAGFYENSCKSQNIETKKIKNI